MLVCNAASVYFLVMSKKSSTFATDFKTKFAYENSITKFTNSDAILPFLLPEHCAHIYCLFKICF